ncbi:polysaccharide deacetylase family protein [Deinococcus sp. KNUC1210]|uniref:YkoP family protein n=1 Tax=Deinococcus sp. KNUC1210 TaxID=2917691 RepID=UPI001EEFE35A|nr:polysaccharide deacetylase family protein [Deinococcus sp. KNUC1210]ULH15308.1 polysaccharide deacetylase family protein [Deinococcus sp. KNUC1210]
MRLSRPLGWLGLGALAAWGLPTLLFQGVGLGVLRTARSARPQAALSFGGGPDPLVTPLLLAALKAADVRATFFVSGSEVQQNSDLLAQIRAAGHQIELGAGRSGWLSAGALSRARLELAAGGTAVQSLLLPRGAVGWPVLLAARRAGLTPASGTVEVRHASDQRERIRRFLRPGGIVLLAGEGMQGAAAARMLPELLSDLTARGYSLLPVNELVGLRPDGWRDVPPKLIQLVDLAYDRLGRIRRIGGHASSLFRVGVAPYPLPSSTLRGGERIEHGASLVEFHLDSARLVQLAERPVAGRHVVKHSLHDLAEAVRDDPAWQQLPAVFSISIFSDVLRIYGFETVELPDRMRRRLTWWSRTLRRAYGVSDLNSEHIPKLAVISRQELIRRFGVRPGR